jgi:hypothetical protein
MFQQHRQFTGSNCPKVNNHLLLTTMRYWLGSDR